MHRDEKEWVRQVTLTISTSRLSQYVRSFLGHSTNGAVCTGIASTKIKELIGSSDLGELCDRPVLMSNPRTLFFGTN